MDTFQALAEPTRREIIELLAEKGQLTSTDISDRFDITPPAVSQHLKVLREANLVTMEKDAQRRLYKINPDKLSEIEDWAKKLNMVWKDRFDKLESVLTNENEK